MKTVFSLLLKPRSKTWTEESYSDSIFQC